LITDDPVNNLHRPDNMNDLREYFEQNEGKLIHKWLHYFEIYDRYFSKFRGTDVHLVEIGVSQGGSLQMWKDYFGPKARIYGIDVNKDCKQLEEDQVEILIGDQGDIKFLKQLKEAIPRIDILLDDGGHTMKQQINTFEQLYPAISENGIYLCEDVHTSYWKKFGGGYRRRGTYIEYAKQLVDQLNAWHSREGNFKVDDFSRSAYGIHFYDSVVVIEKRNVEEPTHERRGQYTTPYHSKPGFWKRVERKVTGKHSGRK